MRIVDQDGRRGRKGEEIAVGSGEKVASITSASVSILNCFRHVELVGVRTSRKSEFRGAGERASEHACAHHPPETSTRRRRPNFFDFAAAAAAGSGSAGRVRAAVEDGLGEGARSHFRPLTHSSLHNMPPLTRPRPLHSLSLAPSPSPSLLLPRFLALSLSLALALASSPSLSPSLPLSLVHCLSSRRLLQRRDASTCTCVGSGAGAGWSSLRWLRSCL
eukprot:768469-Hanusia_phi.AAC.7